MSLVIMALSAGSLASSAQAETLPSVMTRVVHLTFDAPVPSTIADADGNGTGFPWRLPGTGWNLALNDSNLDLASTPGRLTVTSTRSNINYNGDPPGNLDVAETLAVKLADVGANDFVVSALFRGVHLSEPHDQLHVFIATDVDHVFRAGLSFSGLLGVRVYALAKSLNGFDFDVQHVGAGTFYDGDDVRVTITRTGASAYTIVCDNLTSPDDSSSDSVTWDFLSTATDLYVGIYYANNAGRVSEGDTPKVSQVDEFSVYTGIPETEPPVISCPASLAIACSVDLLVPITFSVTASDNCDETPAVACTPPSGSGFPVGTTTVTCTATDDAGNVGTCSLTVTRAPLSFEGFLPPIGGADATGGSFASPVRTFKMGSTIPVKFRASCDGAAVLTGVHTLQVIKWRDDTTSAPPIDATPQDAATTGNKFRPANGEWHFNLDTQATGMSVGNWQLIATLSDASLHSAWIQLK